MRAPCATNSSSLGTDAGRAGTRFGALAWTLARIGVRAKAAGERLVAIAIASAAIAGNAEAGRLILKNAPLASCDDTIP